MNIAIDIMLNEFVFVNDISRYCIYFECHLKLLIINKKKYSIFFFV